MNVPHYRILCAGKDSPHQHLCNLFDQETDSGNDMSRYSELLGQAVHSIARTFQRRVIRHLQSGRDGVLIDQRKQVSETSDFELVTWLVIKDE